MKKKTGTVILITAVSVLLNIIGRTIAVHFRLPVWFDSLGTLIESYCFGPVCGAITGTASDIILGFSDPGVFPFVIVSICIGASAGYFGRKGMFDSFFSSMTYASVLGLFTTAFSTFLDILTKNYETGNLWGDAVIHFFTKAGLYRTASCLIGQFYLEFIDKIVTVSVFYLLIKLHRMHHKKVMRTAAIVVVCLSFLVPCGVRIHADEPQNDSSVQHIYNESDGLTPGHATSLATTFDGILWVGTYAGLYRFDGEAFSLFDSPEIKNVNCLYTDAEGRLWVGTNDNGIAIIINNELVNVINSDDGLCSDSVRSIVQGTDGSVYVGTSYYMQTVTIVNGIAVTGDLKDLNYVDSCDSGADGLIAAAAGDGSIYLLKDGKEMDCIRPDADHDYTSVTFDQDKVYAGTSTGDLCVFSLHDQKLALDQVLEADIGSVVNQVIAEQTGSFLVICDNGLYRVYPDGSRRRISTDNFSFSLQCGVYDYQKNLWIASSRQGLLEIAPSAYTDLFTDYNLKGRIVNAVMKAGSLVYAGCDDGLEIVDQNTGEKTENALSDALSGTRVRALAIDQAGTVYAASYAKGLVSMDRQGNITSYADENSQGNKARCVIVTRDGTVVSSGDNGICFLKDGQIQSLIPYGQELGEVSILSLCELDDGSIAAGTDGNGFFLIKDGQITAHFTKKDNLGSNVVLKVIPARQSNTCFIVSSNGLNVYENGRIRQLSAFPYSNNYDIVFDENGNAYVTGSAGIYITSEDALLNNEGRDAYLSGLADGLPYNLTVNSGNFSDGQYLYLCGSGGVIRADTGKLLTVSSSIRFYVKKISTGEREYQISDDYDVTIPGDSGRITITPEIINFAQPDPIVLYQLKGYENKWHRMKNEDMNGITYTGLKGGEYSFVMDIRDRSGNTLEENAFSFTISQELYERGYFRIYLIAVLLLLIGWISWFFTHLILTNRAKRTQAALELAQKQVEMGNESVLAMAKALFSKDRRTGEHCHRVAYYAEKLGRAYGFSEKETKNLKKAALLHDIGKIAIPDAVLNKPARLNDEEYAIMKTHTTAGAEILRGFTIVDHVAEGARYHHERYDGHGYPEGIAGENIPLYGRIIAICDAFDAMTANRVYRGALDMNQVMDELKKGRGTQFDPHLDDLFMKLIESGEIDPKKTFAMFQNRDLTEDIE